MTQFHQVFFEESFDGLDVLEKGLLNMDRQNVDPEEINAIFRAAHSIKGGSGTFGFTPVSEFTHLLETLLGEIREGRRDLGDDVFDVLLGSVDVLRAMLSAARDGGEPDDDRVSNQQRELERVLGIQPVRGETSGGQAVAAEAVAADATPAGPASWAIGFRPHRNMMHSGNDPLRIIRELASFGELEVRCMLDDLPSLEALDPEGCYLAWQLSLEAPIGAEAIRDLFAWVEEECDLSLSRVQQEVDPAAEPKQALAHQPDKSAPPALKALDPPAERRVGEERRSSGERRRGAGSERAAAAAGNSIRVDTGKIDALINRVGELVITQSMLGLLGEDFSMHKIGRLREGLAQLERHTRELQESVMQIRMLPISFTFSRFPRLVHDLSHQLGKQIELQLSGETTEVDKTVIEKIGDPLVHLVRNSVDHGIESPQERVAAGKPETGSVHLSAEHRAGNIVIQISDDGRGLARDRILHKGVEQGLVSPEENLTDKQVYDLIFQPGFSTAEQLSDVSGRGVGMDVVRRNINELGGAVEIDSILGQGSTFTIRLPLTLAILDGQAIRIADEIYIVPLLAIVESLQVSAGMLQHIAGKGEVFRLRDEYLPIVRMHDIFGVEQPAAARIEDGIVVVVEYGGARCGLLVDELMSQQQVVIKSLEANYGRIDGISAATILGDGSVALILDIPGVMRMATREAPSVQSGMCMTA